MITGEDRPTDADETPMTVVTVPDDQAQAVIDFVTGLESRDDEVTGHMISTGFGGALRTGALMERMKSSTNCKLSQTGTHGTDMTCSDSDKIVV